MSVTVNTDNILVSFCCMRQAVWFWWLKWWYLRDQFHFSVCHTLCTIYHIFTKLNGICNINLIRMSVCIIWTREALQTNRCVESHPSDHVKLTIFHSSDCFREITSRKRTMCVEQKCHLSANQRNTVNKSFYDICLCSNGRSADTDQIIGTDQSYVHITDIHQVTFCNLGYTFCDLLRHKFCVSCLGKISN